MTREQMIDEAVRKVCSPEEMRRIVGYSKGLASYRMRVKPERDIRLICAEFWRIVARWAVVEWIDGRSRGL